MDVVNESGLAVGFVVGKVRDPQYSATIIVKGTLALSPDAVASLLPEQPGVTGDVFAEDDYLQPLLYPSDFAYFKPHAEVMLAGTCHPPAGKAAKISRASFRVNAWSKTVVVIGRRYWRERIFRGGASSEPEPFLAMPITYDRAYGGPGFPRNPLGAGHASVVAGDRPQARPLPNIEIIDRLIVNPDTETEPAGFGPIPGTWPQRASKTGKYGKEWLKERWPWFPEDFDWSFFNAAPQDQQLSGYLRGDEKLELENLHPGHARYLTSLPGLRVRCFVTELVKAHIKFHEVPMNLDTLFVDMDAGRAVLVWRGLTPVRTLKMPELIQLLVAVERLGDPPMTPLHYRGILEDALLREKAELQALELEEPPEPETPEEEAVLEKPEGDVEPEETEPPEALEGEVEAGEEALESGAGEEAAAEGEGEQETAVIPAAPPIPLTPLEDWRERQDALLEARETFLRHGAPVPDALEEALLEPPPGGGEEEAGEESEAELEDEGLAGADEGPDEQREPDEPPEPDEEPGAREEAPDEPEAPSYEELLERIGRKESLEGMDLSGIVLAELDLGGLLLRGAILEDADLSRANLSGADLSGATLSRASLADADCRNAFFTEADLAGASLDRADLSGANLEDADLSGASLRESKLPGAAADRAILAGADLSFADLEGAHLEGADLTEARLHNANLSRAVLRSASIERCWGQEVRADEADLTELRGAEACLGESSFRKVLAPGSVWEGAQLYGADFTGARLDGAELSGAYAAQSCFDGAELKEAILDEAVLRSASMVRSNLFLASMVAADLTGVDLRESSLCDAELRDAILEGANLKGAFMRFARLPAGWEG